MWCSTVPIQVEVFKCRSRKQYRFVALDLLQIIQRRRRRRTKVLYLILVCAHGMPPPPGEPTTQGTRAPALSARPARTVPVRRDGKLGPYAGLGSSTQAGFSLGHGNKCLSAVDAVSLLLSSSLKTTNSNHRQQALLRSTLPAIPMCASREMQAHFQNRRHEGHGFPSASQDAATT